MLAQDLLHHLMQIQTCCAKHASDKPGTVTIPQYQCNKTKQRTPSLAQAFHKYFLTRAYQGLICKTVYFQHVRDDAKLAQLVRAQECES